MRQAETKTVILEKGEIFFDAKILAGCFYRKTKVFYGAKIFYGAKKFAVVLK